MLYFKNADNDTRAIDDESQRVLIPEGWTEITREQALAIAETRQAPDPVPQVVTRFQALAALHRAGHLETVQALMNAPDTPVLSKLAWDNALSFERSSPALANIAAALGLSDADLDELFTTAAGIEA